jgi:hypothetical protein
MDNMPEGRWTNWVVSDHLLAYDDVSFGREVPNFVGSCCPYLQGRRINITGKEVSDMRK